MKFTLDNKEIQDWLLSRKWLHFIGKTRLNSGIFYPCTKEAIKTSIKCKETDFPYYNEDFEIERIYLENARQNCYTWAFPAVVLKIWGYEKDVQNDKFELNIFFNYGRGETHYERVFDGYIKDFDEFMFIMRAIGIHENFLTGKQTIGA